MANDVALGLSVTLCIVLVVVLIVTAVLLYRQVKKNKEEKRLREERMRRQQLEEAFQPMDDLPTVSGSVTNSMTSLYDNKDDTALVPDSRREPYLHVYDNPPSYDSLEDTVRVRTSGASVGGRRAQRVSYSKGNPAQNGHVTSSNMEAQPVALHPVGAGAYQNSETGYGSLGLDTMGYGATYGTQQMNNVQQYSGNTSHHVTSTPTSRDREHYANGVGQPRGNTTSCGGTVV